MLRITLLACSVSVLGWADTPPKSLHPQIQKIVSEVSEERITAILKKMETFGTRNLLSETDSPTRGIGAARRWIFQEMRSYSPRLQVGLDRYMVKKKDRVIRDVELDNVVAILPGTTQKDRYVLISGHYDSLAIVRKKDTRPDSPIESIMDNDLSAKAEFAPGITDDASGTAAVMELARVMSRYEFEKSIIFVAFAGEEQGLVGSTLYAEKAKKSHMDIEAVLNNDIIGSDLAGNGRRANDSINIYSGDPNDSPSRSLARYVKEVGERYLPSFRVNLVFRNDRFARGGDHTPFEQRGFAAVRFTTPTEHFANQHSVTDTFANTSPSYIAEVTKLNGAVLASLALAPKPPVVTREGTTGINKGHPVPMIARGKSGYDAALKWTNPSPEADLAGYSVLIRNTIAPLWEREIYVGNVLEYTLPNLLIDDVVVGVRAVDKAGVESLVSAYVSLTRPAQTFEADELPTLTDLSPSTPGQP